jgi:superfamily I DNA and/or RNA helicase
VDGSAESKWCPEEGELVVDLLRHLAAARVHQPDIYVITPFRVVAHEMRKRIAAESDLLRSLGVDSRQWLQERVGTIHTFQGKEAEAVIAILGAPTAAQQGARRWAASSPNIFNVMVSRAKEALYIVGSHAAWSSVGHGATIAAHLPIFASQSEGSSSSVL